MGFSHIIMINENNNNKRHQTKIYSDCTHFKIIKINMIFSKWTFGVGAEWV